MIYRCTLACPETPNDLRLCLTTACPRRHETTPDSLPHQGLPLENHPTVRIGWLRVRPESVLYPHGDIPMETSSNPDGGGSLSFHITSSANSIEKILI